MPVLTGGTFTFVGAQCISGGFNTACIAHGLPTQPDWAIFQGMSSFGAAVSVVSRTAAIVWLMNTGGSAVAGEVVAQFVHSVVR